MKRILRLVTAAAVLILLLAALAVVSSAAELTTDIGTVESETGLYLREKPSTKAPVIATAAEGDYVMLIRRVGDWYLVNFNMQVGYMHADYLGYADYGRVNLGQGDVDTLVVNVRSGPNTDSELVTQIYSGSSVMVLGTEDGWCRVKAGNSEGYVRSDLVTLLERPIGNYGTATMVLSGSVDAEAEISAARAAAEEQRSSSSGSGDSGSGTGVTSGTSLGQQIASFAQNYLGSPYVYGGSSPSGFDCSGFTQYIFRQFGIHINRTATAQLADGYSVSYGDLRPGDIVYFGSGNSAFHVGIYIGNGMFIHAENYGTGVVITSLSSSYYANSYLCAHRIVG